MVKLNKTQKCKFGLTLEKSSNIINHIKGLKEKSCICKSIDVEKLSDKIQQPLMIF